MALLLFHLCVVCSAYLDDIRIIEDYFGPTTRKRQRTVTAAAQREPKLPILDRYAHVPSALMSTSSTISSELDYWSCLDSMMATDQDDLALPRRYDSTAATLNGRLLFSPMHATAGGSSNDALARRLSKSLSPHPSNVWAGGYRTQFHEDNDNYEDNDEDDEGDDDDDDAGSKSASHYSSSELHRAALLPPSLMPQHKKLVEPSSSSAAAAAASAPASSSVSIYFSPNAAQNERAVAPMMAS